MSRSGSARRSFVSRRPASRLILRPSPKLVAAHARAGEGRLRVAGRLLAAPGVDPDGGAATFAIETAPGTKLRVRLAGPAVERISGVAPGARLQLDGRTVGRTGLFLAFEVYVGA